MPRWLQLLFFILMLLLAGCRQEEANPENLDPIYSYLVKQEADSEGKLASEQKKLEGAKTDYSLADARTIEKRNAEREIARASHAIEVFKQTIMYEKIRVERRKVEDKLNYHEAFVAKKEWPPKDEYEEFLTHQRLVSAPRSWDAHLKDLFARKPASAAKPPPKAEE